MVLLNCKCGGGDGDGTHVRTTREKAHEVSSSFYLSVVETQTAGRKKVDEDEGKVSCCVSA